MSQKSFNTIAGGVFLLVALFHLWRIISGYPVTFGEAFIPVWVSWIGLVVGAVLGYYGIKHGRK